MHSAHLTLAIFCHFLLASVVFYFTSLSAASPLLAGVGQQQPIANGAPSKQYQTQQQVVAGQPAAPAAKSPAMADAAKDMEQRSAVNQPQKSSSGEKEAIPLATVAAAVANGKKYDSPQEARSEASKGQAKAVAKHEAGQEEYAAKSAAESVLTQKDSDTVQPSYISEQKKTARKEVDPVQAAPTSPLDSQQQPAKAAAEHQAKDKQQSVKEPEKPQAAALVAPSSESSKPVVSKYAQEPAGSAPAGSEPVVFAHPEPAQKPVETRQASAGVAHGSVGIPSVAPVVMGGLGPLHLLATTLCSYQPDKPAADENLSQLYARRAIVRKSLFDFMSLKFTNLEKLSSRLGHGLQVVPSAVVANSQLEPVADSKPGLVPSHGWPVVGKCTAYDLRLMGEASWCDYQPESGESRPSASASNQQESNSPAPTTSQVAPAAADAAIGQPEDKPAPITSNQHRVAAGRSISGDTTYSLLPTPEESSVISKILHVGASKSAPLAESSILNLNLTQQQLATLEAHATSTQECRRNALRYSKALFNHLAEDQQQVSESWPKLYAAISADDCARKRLIDVFTALSGFRTDTTSIRRDNLEFAFAMDDLRAKVLENEVNAPLTFDRHFIEVEQFLQQSVRLMLANIQPKRAQLTTMRYRSLMYGAASDEQCLDLHQRLLARNYPSDCNPTQFGQLPDVLRMTASSLELWSIEKELSMRMAKAVDYPNESPVGQQKVKENVNECVANLVSS